ncbi:hypothetical protein DTO282E5_8106 [Paecilomyces variotii]|nr:hypothetical protein DTO282E5_8106 [Paecilomyces variotii]
MSLKKSKYYQNYLDAVAKGRLTLPDIDPTEPLILKVGEVYCRYPDCPERLKRYSATNNLRHHYKVHFADNESLITAGKSGTPSMEVIMDAISWYKSITMTYDE